MHLQFVGSGVAGRERVPQKGLFYKKAIHSVYEVSTQYVHPMNVMVKAVYTEVKHSGSGVQVQVSGYSKLV